MSYPKNPPQIAPAQRKAARMTKKEQKTKDEKAFNEMGDVLTEQKCGKKMHLYAGTSKPGDKCRCGKAIFLEMLVPPATALALIARCETAERERDELKWEYDNACKFSASFEVKLASARVDQSFTVELNRKLANHNADLSAENAKLRMHLDWFEANGIHTCHDECQKLECVQGREIRRLKLALANISLQMDQRKTFKDWAEYFQAVASQALTPKEPEHGKG